MQLPKYENKPFKPPRRINGELKNTLHVPQIKLERQLAPTSVTSAFKRTITQESTSSIEPKELRPLRLFTIMYRKPSNKKHKTWTGDGYSSLKGGDKYCFYNETGNLIGVSLYSGDIDMLYDNVFRVSGLEIQLDYEITEPIERQRVQKILDGIRHCLEETESNDLGEDILNEICEETQESKLYAEHSVERKAIKKFKPLMKQEPFRNQIKSDSNTVNDGDMRKQKRKYCSLFDLTNIDNPVIMNKESTAEVDVIVDPIISKKLRSHQREGVKFMYDCVLGLSRKCQASDFQGDITKDSMTLEPDSDIHGCLLADEMGLGKTLTTIALIWTLLKQTPFASTVPCSQTGIPLQGLINKVLIVCPVTLIANWKKEFGKWLHLSRIGILTLNPQNSSERDKYEVRTFLRVQRTYQVLILGYEKLLSVSNELEKGKSFIDLLVCDEGHRLKNGASKILNTLKTLDISRKILLSGTPIQNDLNEFFTVIDFINPGILGSYQNFKKKYILPISRARDPANRYNKTIVQEGEEKSQEMITMTQRFVLRRTNSVIESYLPAKMDIILFCKPTPTQIRAFKDVLNRSGSILQGHNQSSSLALITLLKKICNSPSLIKDDFYFNFTLKDPSLFGKYEYAINSGKLKVLMTLLERIKNGTEGEKVVIVSNYTQTLDIIENLMISAGMRICRMDGSTPNKERDKIVTSFNGDPSLFSLLLSAKSGGVGLNLIGASRLILFDNDWNPSVDVQAMSRIHRDGQKRPCYIYRLVTTGCIDEKILQRQLMKLSLSQKFLDDSFDNKGMADDDLFSKDDLKDIFSIFLDTISNTHDLICSCDGIGEEIRPVECPLGNTEGVSIKNMDLDLTTWMTALEAQESMKISNTKNKQEKYKLMKRCLVGYKHIDPNRVKDLIDKVSTETVEKAEKDITFAFIKPPSL